jgi:hypothetical protein
MSEIPFVNQLGDNLERAIAARRRRFRRRIGVGAVAFAVAASGIAAASGVLSGSPEQLAGNAVGCYDRADVKGNTSVLAAGHETPIETCRRVLGIKGPLVACAGDAVLVFPGGPGTCERLGFEPLPAEYASARARVLALQRELATLERTADCEPLDAFAEKAQRLLERLGWTGWRVEVRDDLGEGPCGSALAMNGDGSRSIEGSLLHDERRLIVTPGPRRSTLDLLTGPGVRVMDATGERCYSVADVEQLVRDRLPSGERTLTFTTSSLPARAEIADKRGKRLAEGCAVIVGFAPTPDDRGIVVEIWR